MGKAVLPRTLLASKIAGIPILRPKKKAKTTTAPISWASSSVETYFIVAPFEEAGVLLSSPTPIFTTAALPELLKEFVQLKKNLRSSRHFFESLGLQDQHRVF